MFIVLITKSYDKSVWCNFSVHCQKVKIENAENFYSVSLPIIKKQSL